MYAQLVPIGTTRDCVAQVDRLVADHIIPALRAEPGFAGIWNLVERTTGAAMMIVLWDSAEQARRPVDECGAAFQRALARLAAVAQCELQPSSAWEIGARV